MDEQTHDLPGSMTSGFEHHKYVIQKGDGSPVDPDAKYFVLRYDYVLGGERMKTYPKDWPEIAERIKDHADWKCVRCQHPHDVESGHVLTVHHLDGDKSNCADWNLPALCQRCHLHIQAKVKMDQTFMFDHSEWFKPYLEGRERALGRAGETR